LSFIDVTLMHLLSLFNVIVVKSKQEAHYRRDSARCGYINPRLKSVI